MVPEAIEEFDLFFTVNKRLISSAQSFDTQMTINEDNVTSSFNYFFALQYEEENTDVWGLSKFRDGSKRGLYINYFDPTFGSPSWDPPKPPKVSAPPG